VGQYLAQIDAAAPDRRWGMARGWLLGEPLPFLAELRAERPVLALPEVTLASRFHDCAMVLRRHHDFGVDLYRPKQGDYFMTQDDTADHWRDKSIMKSILDYEDVPAMRQFVAQTANEILDSAKGSIDAPRCRRCSTADCPSTAPRRSSATAPSLRWARWRRCRAWAWRP
jgi:cytochrome P450